MQKVLHDRTYVDINKPMSTPGEGVTDTPAIRPEIRYLGALAHIIPVPEMDVYTAPAFRESIVEAYSHEGVTTALIDLREVSFIDATATGVLVGGLKRFRTGGGKKDLVLLGPLPPRISKCLEISHLNTVFKVVDENLDEIPAQSRPSR